MTDEPRLASLLDAWRTLQERRPTLDARMFHASVKDLAARVIAYRGVLFEANATLQAEAPLDDDPTILALLEANQVEIKACTNALTEMNAALGR